MRVDIEKVREMQEYRRKINEQELKDIEWYEKGKKIGHSSEEIEEFKFTGLNNIDFITGNFTVITGTSKDSTSL